MDDARNDVDDSYFDNVQHDVNETQNNFDEHYYYQDYDDDIDYENERFIEL